MQLLYGSDRKNYRVLSKSSDMTGDQERTLVDIYCTYQPVNDKTPYSDVEHEPAAYIYASTNLVDTLPEERILWIQKGKMTNVNTPSFYAHAYLLKPEKEDYSENFFNLFKRDFVRSDECLQFHASEIDRFDRWTNGERNKEALPAEKTAALVGSILNVADSTSRVVRLLNDADGDDYTERALDIVETIYRCLPYGVRRRAGFSTYASAGERIPGTIKLQIYAREALKEGLEKCIDLRNMDSEEILSRLPDKTASFARRIVYCKEEREHIFEELQRILAEGPASAEEHIELYFNLEWWKNEDLTCISDRAAEYAATIRSRNSGSAREFRKIMEQRYSQDFYEDQLKKILDDQTPEGISAFNKQMKQYLLLGEELSSLQIPFFLFEQWQRDTVFPFLKKRTDEGGNYVDELKRLYENTEQTTAGRKKFKKVKELLLNSITEELELSRSELQKQWEGKKEERQNDEGIVFDWQEKRDILNFLVKYESWPGSPQVLPEGRAEADPDIKIKIGENVFSVRESEAYELSCWLLLDGEKNEEVRAIWKNDPELLMELDKAKFLGERQLYEWCQYAKESPEMLQTILAYCIQSRRLLTLEKLIPCFYRVDWKENGRDNADNVRNNIFNIARKEYLEVQKRHKRAGITRRLLWIGAGMGMVCILLILAACIICILK